MRPSILLPLILGCVGTSLFAERQTVPLASDWRFIRRDVGASAPLDSTWRTLSLPHSWNIQDGGKENGPDGRYRGAGWYSHKLPVSAALKGKRVFVRFEAAAIVADVYLNGQFLGQHRGAFGAFCFELTKDLRLDGSDELRVRVDNSTFQDVPPLEGDFTLHGGLYRPVSLLVTEPDCISPLDHSSSGVYLTVQKASSAEALVEARTLLSSSTVQPGTEVAITVQDASGQVVTQAQAPTQGSTSLIPLRIPKPILWQGRKNPYLYTALVQLKRGGQILDEVRQPLGLRTIQISQDCGVLLNGEPYAVHGVNRHQDREGQGWALSSRDHAEDIQTILDMGCTGLRLAHYPQSSEVHDLCDRGGLLVWQEIPLVNVISGLSQFRENAKQQLEEMILQGYNHPSLCFWGLFNELNAAWAKVPGPSPDSLIAELRQQAERLDSTRPTVGASWIREAAALHQVPGWIAFNVYPGWYWGTPEDFTPLVSQLSGTLQGKRIGISEYGAGASIRQHQEGALAPPKDTATSLHPEEWQAALHERLWAQAKDNPSLWGTFLWVMFDFSSEGRKEGDTPARNDKGLITADRQIRKDAFYFYQANWSEKPVLHLASKRLNVRRQAITEVKAYANCLEVELRVNGISQGRQKPDGVHTFRWPSVSLKPGLNRIELKARHGNQELSDACEWQLETK